MGLVTPSVIQPQNHCNTVGVTDLRHELTLFTHTKNRDSYRNTDDLQCVIS